MSEIVEYRGKNVNIGTEFSLYYVSYQKYSAALAAGELKEAIGNLEPYKYARPDSVFLFRFPYPDEDKLPFGRIVDPFNRVVPLKISPGAFFLEGEENLINRLEVAYQQPVTGLGKEPLHLELVVRNPASGKYYRFDRNDIKTLLKEIVRNNIGPEHDQDRKIFLRQVSRRIMSGYGMRTRNVEAKTSVVPSEDRQQLIGKELNTRKNIGRKKL